MRVKHIRTIKTSTLYYEHISHILRFSLSSSELAEETQKKDIKNNKNYILIDNLTVKKRLKKKN